MNKSFRLTDFTGNTPVVELRNHNINSGKGIFVKIEGMNPAGSVKDRAALYMINRAEKEGLISREINIVEPTSGNTGIALAAICASRGYSIHLVMQENMSRERIKIMRAYGAKIILTSAELGMQGAVDKALELSSEKNFYMPDQFSNRENIRAHYETTGPELWDQTEGKIDVLVSGVGTGGTITGTSMFIKERKPDFRAVAVEPAESAVLSGEKRGNHGIQGIGAGFIPDLVDMKYIDDICKVCTEDALRYMRALAVKEGVFAGISSGAALCAACRLKEKAKYRDKLIVAVLPDSGYKYLSGDCFSRSFNYEKQSDS